MSKPSPKPRKRKALALDADTAKRLGLLGTDDNARLTAIEARQADLEARIAALEKAAASQVPWTFPPPPLPDVWPNLPIPGSDDARCVVCGGRYRDMSLYVCSNPQCPSRVTCGDAPKPPYIGDPLPGTPGHITVTWGGASMSPDNLPSYKPSDGGPHA